MSEFWHGDGEVEMYALIADARLVVLKNLDWISNGAIGPRHGWRWVVIPLKGFCGPMDIESSFQSDVLNSEVEPYPTIEAAQDACLNFYVREFHPEDTGGDDA